MNPKFFCVEGYGDLLEESVQKLLLQHIYERTSMCQKVDGLFDQFVMAIANEVCNAVA